MWEHHSSQNAPTGSKIAFDSPQNCCEKGILSSASSCYIERRKQASRSTKQDSKSQTGFTLKLYGRKNLLSFPRLGTCCSRCAAQARRTWPGWQCRISAPLQTYWIRLCILTRSPGNSCGQWNLRRTAFCHGTSSIPASYSSSLSSPIIVCWAPRTDVPGPVLNAEQSAAKRLNSSCPCGAVHLTLWFFSFGGLSKSVVEPKKKKITGA